MKILTGELKGRLILFKTKPGVRPTADKVRKAIFDALQGRLEGSRVLDLFSGTGALGLEALSLGAGRALFVEEDGRQARSIQEALDSLDLADRGGVMAQDAVKAIHQLGQAAEPFDLIFLDPPYGKGLAQKALTLLSGSAIVPDGGLVILECGKRENFPSTLGNLKRVKTKLHGDTKIIFYLREGGV